MAELHDYEREYAFEVASKGYYDTLVEYLDNGVPVNLTNDRRQSLLHLASVSGHMDCVQLLLVRNADVNTQDYDGKTALHLAAQAGHIGVVKTMLSHGKPDIEIDKKDHAKHTPLYYAIKGNFARTVKALLEAGADYRVTPKFTDTLALTSSNEIKQMLRDAKAAQRSVEPLSP